MVRFLRKSPEVLQALQCMENKFLKSSSPLNADTKLSIVIRGCDKPCHPSLLRDGVPRQSRMLWAVRRIEHPALRGGKDLVWTGIGLLAMSFFKQDVSGAWLWF